MHNNIGKILDGFQQPTWKVETSDCEDCRSQLRAEIAQEIKQGIRKTGYIGSHQNLKTLKYESCLIIDSADWNNFWTPYEVKK